MYFSVHLNLLLLDDSIRSSFKRAPYSNISVTYTVNLCKETIGLCWYYNLDSMLIVRHHSRQFR